MPRLGEALERHAFPHRRLVAPCGIIADEPPLPLGHGPAGRVAHYVGEGFVLPAPFGPRRHARQSSDGFGVNIDVPAGCPRFRDVLADQPDGLGDGLPVADVIVCESVRPRVAHFRQCLHVLVGGQAEVQALVEVGLDSMVAEPVHRVDGPLEGEEIVVEKADFPEPADDLLQGPPRRPDAALVLRDLAEPALPYATPREESLSGIFIRAVFRGESLGLFGYALLGVLRAHPSVIRRASLDADPPAVDVEKGGDPCPLVRVPEH